MIVKNDTRQRNSLLNELAEELEKTNGYQKYLSNNKSSTATRLQSFKVLKSFFKKSSKDFDSTKSSDEEETEGAIEIETASEMIHRYFLIKDRSIESLKQFPAVGELFIRYNTSLVSSAPCERLFSAAKAVLSMGRTALCPLSFEAQLLLNVNSKDL